MFGMSFYEIAIIAIVALVILGPEKLPEVARTAGKFLRQAREMSTAFRDTIMMEADLHEKKQKKKSSTGTSTALLTASAATTASRVGQFDLDEDYEGPLDQLHDEYFHMHPPDDVYTDRVDVALESHQMPDPYNSTEIELSDQLPEHADPGEDALAAHLANPFDSHLVERRDITLKPSRHVGARS